jgi:hypothetical protein
MREAVIYSNHYKGSFLVLSKIRKTMEDGRRRPSHCREGGPPATTSSLYEISLASPKAAAAATPPIAMVCNALRAGPVPV